MMLHHLETQRRSGIGKLVAASRFVDTMLNEVFGKPKNIGYRPSTETHESRDVSFTFGQVPLLSPANDPRYIDLKLSTNLELSQLSILAYQIQLDLERVVEEEDEATVSTY